MGIAVIGPVFLDVKGYPNSAYIPGGRNSGSVEYVHGGVSRNIAEDIGNVELNPAFISLVDDNATGEDIITKLNKHKVNTDYVLKTKDGMGTWLAIFDNTGDVVASISKRPDVTPLLELFEKQGDEIISGCDSVSLEIDTDKDIVKKVIRLAKKHNKKIYAVISNMTIGIERRDYFKDVACLVCNQQEMGILFYEDYSSYNPEELAEILLEKIKNADMHSMIVTMGSKGAVYADADSNICGTVPALKVDVIDTTGAGDAFFAGACIGLTYGKTMEEACRIGTSLAASVIITYQNVCPRFMPSEFGIEINQ